MVSMTREELYDFIVSEIKEKRPDLENEADKIAKTVMALPSMRSQAGVQGFLKGYLGGKANQ